MGNLLELADGELSGEGEVSNGLRMHSSHKPETTAILIWLTLSSIMSLDVAWAEIQSRILSQLKGSMHGYISS